MRKRFAAIPIVLNVENAAHLNMIVIDNKAKTLERFEPHGAYSSKKYGPEKLDELLNSWSKDMGLRYIPTNLVCPNFQWMYKGVQRGKTFIEGDPGGYCTAWGLWYINLRLKNPNMPPLKLLQNAINSLSVGGDDDFRKFIRNYADHVLRIVRLEKN